MTQKNSANSAAAKLGPKKVLTPNQIFSRSLKQIGAAKTLDDLVLAAYVGAGCADALLLSGLIDIEAYHEQNPAGQLAFSA
tara:strand:+ start:8106 stop:8348 length:243 start_codon:yes stop_codon:yes gene_type:complete